jgi:hypothetical protein
MARKIAIKIGCPVAVEQAFLAVSQGIIAVLRLGTYNCDRKVIPNRTAGFVSVRCRQQGFISSKWMNRELETYIL